MNEEREPHVPLREADPDTQASSKRGSAATGGTQEPMPLDDAKPALQSDPTSRFFWGTFLIAAAVGLLLYFRTISWVEVPVLKNSVKAYYDFTEKDLTVIKKDGRTVGTDIIQRKDDLVRRYARTAIPAKQMISKNQVAVLPPSLSLKNAVVVGIPADRAMMIGETLEPGDMVLVSAIPEPQPTRASALPEETSARKHDAATPGSASPAAEIKAEPVELTALVLDTKASDKGSVIVLAIQQPDWKKYAMRLPYRTWILARQLS